MGVALHSHPSNDQGPEQFERATREIQETRENRENWLRRRSNCTLDNGIRYFWPLDVEVLRAIGRGLPSTRAAGLEPAGGQQTKNVMMYPSGVLPEFGCPNARADTHPGARTHTHRHTQTETDRHSDRHRVTDTRTHTHAHTHTHTDGHRGRQREGAAEGEGDAEEEGHPDGDAEAHAQNTQSAQGCAD